MLSAKSIKSMVLERCHGQKSYDFWPGRPRDTAHTQNQWNPVELRQSQWFYIFIYLNGCLMRNIKIHRTRCICLSKYRKYIISVTVVNLEDFIGFGCVSCRGVGLVKNHMSFDHGIFPEPLILYFLLTVQHFL